jgi:hypothetical protein
MTVLDALGGNDFLMRTGARIVTQSDESVQVRLPMARARNRIRYVRICVDPTNPEMYEIRCYRAVQGGMGLELVDYAGNLLSDQLAPYFKVLTNI